MELYETLQAIILLWMHRIDQTRKINDQAGLKKKRIIIIPQMFYICDCLAFLTNIIITLGRMWMLSLGCNLASPDA